MNENWTSKNPPPELSDEDAELLSAYIDNMLDATERAALESRLEADAFLRSELAAMRQMLGWLKTMPQLKAPRNFTISEADVKPAAVPPKLIVMPRRNNWQVLSAAAAIFLVAIGFAAFIVNNPTNKNQDSQIAAAPTGEALDEAAGNAPAPEEASPILMATMGVPPVANGGSSTGGGASGSGGGGEALEPAEPSTTVITGESAELERSMDTDTGTDGSNPADTSVQSALLEATSTVAAASGGQVADMVMPTQTASSVTIFAYTTETAQPTIGMASEESMAMNAQQSNAESTEDLTILSAPVEESEADDAENTNLAMVTTLASPSSYIRDVARGLLLQVIEGLRR